LIIGSTLQVEKCNYAIFTLFEPAGGLTEAADVIYLMELGNYRD